MADRTGERRHPWQAAHDALAAHGRARIAKRPDGELQVLWQDYCLALDAATACGVEQAGWLSTSESNGEFKPPRLAAIPTGCDCVWSVSVVGGRRSGSIFIASERCQKALMHPRTFTEPAAETASSDVRSGLIESNRTTGASETEITQGLDG